MKEQVFPYPFDQRKITAKQFWGHIIPYHCHNSTTTGANRIGVAGADNTIIYGDVDDWCFLFGKRWNSICAHNVRDQIDVYQYLAMTLSRKISLHSVL